MAAPSARHRPCPRSGTSRKGGPFVGALKLPPRARLEIEGECIVREERRLEGMGERIRDVAREPDGHLHLLIDEDDGRILRLELAS